MAILRLQRELLGVTLTLSAVGFANGLVAIFVPLVILDSGAPLWQIPAFYVTYAVLKLLINYPIARYVVQQRGAHAALGLGLGAAIVQMIALQGFIAAEQWQWLFVAAASLALVNASL